MSKNLQFVKLINQLHDKWSGGVMVKVSASQPRDPGFEPHTGHDHDSSYDTSTGWFEEEDSRVTCFTIEQK